MVSRSTRLIAREEPCRHFGNLYGLTRYVDKSLTHEDYIVFESGTHTDAIKLSYQDYERIAKPRIEDLATKLHPIKRA